MNKATDLTMRYFEGGATRQSSDGKLDYSRFLCPRVLRRYCEYLDKHRVQADGKLRSPDNWKNGMPIDEAYLPSLLRHVNTVWEKRQFEQDTDITDELCAVIFNASGWLFEELRKNG